MARGQQWTTLLASIVATCAFGCEPMESTGNLTQPVKVAASAGGAGAASAEGGSDPAFEVAEPVKLSSEQMRDHDPKSVATHGPAGQDHAAEEGSEDAVAVASSPSESAATSDAVVTAPPVAATPASPTSTASPALPTPMGAQWPVRLVRTLPDTQPPRAILGLADGRELVVAPGSMIPDHNLIVMAVGKQSAQVARIAPNGDHAVVSQKTLTALY